MPFKTFAIKPLTGVFDTLSSADEIGYGHWRVVKNSVTRSTRNRQRAGGWRKLFADDAVYNNQDLHDQLTDRLSYYESFDGHAMGGGGLSGYSYPYFFPSTAIPEHSVFPPASGPYCNVYYPDYDGVYGGCPIFYPFVGYPYTQIPGSVSTTNLVSHWRLDAVVAPGVFADNVSGVNLTNFGAPTEAGLIGNAAAFHVGGDDFLQSGTAPQLDAGPGVKFGMTGWIYRFSDGVGEEYVWRKGAGPGFREYRLILSGPAPGSTAPNPSSDTPP